MAVTIFMFIFIIPLRFCTFYVYKYKLHHSADFCLHKLLFKFNYDVPVPTFIKKNSCDTYLNCESPQRISFQENVYLHSVQIFFTSPKFFKTALEIHLSIANTPKCRQLSRIKILKCLHKFQHINGSANKKTTFSPSRSVSVNCFTPPRRGFVPSRIDIVKRRVLN